MEENEELQDEIERLKTRQRRSSEVFDANLGQPKSEMKEGGASMAAFVLQDEVHQQLALLLKCSVLYVYPRKEQTFRHLLP